MQKDKSKGNIASNYRPITCLPLMWKLLRGVISDQIYGHLDQQNLLPEEQKVCRKRSRGTNNLLSTDSAVIREVKFRKKNLVMTWIDYKKAYDIVPHSWTKECLDLLGVAENTKNLLVNSMKKRRGMLCAGNLEFGEVDIKLGIVQGDSLSPLVFVFVCFGWRKCELQTIDGKTRKLFTIYGEFHTKSDVGRLYIRRKIGGRGLIAIKDCVDLAVRGLEVYVHGSEERLIQTARGDKLWL